MPDSESLKTNFQKILSSKKQELNLLLQKLIRIRSYTGEEKQIVEFIIEKMKTFGFDEAYSDGLGNAVGRIGNGPVKILYDARQTPGVYVLDENKKIIAKKMTVEQLKTFLEEKLN